MEEFEDLVWLRDHLKTWAENNVGSLRVELRLVDKHMGEVSLESLRQSCWPRLDLGMLEFELEEALQAAAFVRYLRKLGRDIVQSELGDDN